MIQHQQFLSGLKNKNLNQIKTTNNKVRFQSAGTYATQKAKSYPYLLNESTSREHSHGELYRNFIRKESCSFAWDWGPCFMPQVTFPAIHQPNNDRQQEGKNNHFFKFF